MNEGEQVYNQHLCRVSSSQWAGHATCFPALKGSNIAIGPVMAHIDIVLNGKTWYSHAGF